MRVLEGSPCLRWRAGYEAPRLPRRFRSQVEVISIATSTIRFVPTTFSSIRRVYYYVKTNEQEEYELAVQARKGDLDALSELVERLRLRLFAVAYADAISLPYSAE